MITDRFEDTVKGLDPPTSESDNNTIGESVFVKIRNDILLGALQPGIKLKLSDLQRDYGVSINTLRENLMRLAAEGLVVAEGQKGFRVVPASIDDLREITELRKLIECHGLQMSIENGDLDWEGRVVSAHHMLARCEQSMMQDSAKHWADWQRFDRQFHVALISACNSRWILRMHRIIHDQFRRYQILALNTIAFRGKELVDEHRLILEHTVNRDSDAAVAMLAAHIQKGVDLPVGDGAAN
jgi:GntR family transcriptional regulator, carbon starvation induced regulator